MNKGTPRVGRLPLKRRPTIRMADPDAISRMNTIIGDTLSAASAEDRKASFREMVQMDRDLSDPDAPNMTADEMCRRGVRIGQMYRDCTGDTDDAFYMVARYIDEYVDGCMYDRDSELKRIHDAMDAIEAREGLGHLEFWKIGEGPDDWNQLQEQADHRLDDLLVKAFRQFGEDALADLYMNDRDEYDRRMEAGRDKIFGPLPPDVQSKLDAAKTERKNS